MNKILLCLSFFMFCACTLQHSNNSFIDEKRALCREAADTILAYMPGWKEIYSGYVDAPFHVGDNEYSKIVLSVIAVKGKDTLEITTDEFQCYSKGISTEEDSAWVGEIGRVYPYEENVSVIKRHNLLMKELFKDVPGFTLKVNNNLLQAIFIKFKPVKKLKHEDYGLTEDDVKGTEMDTVLL